MEDSKVSQVRNWPVHSPSQHASPGSAQGSLGRQTPPAPTRTVWRCCNTHTNGSLLCNLCHRKHTLAAAAWLTARSRSHRERKAV